MNLPSNILLQGGKYRIIRFISSGGFGCTYEAELVLLHKRVAIKEFFVKDFCNRDEKTCHVTVATQSKVKLIERLKQKFIEEASALFSMQHLNIVRVTDVFEENGTAYYVMDYIDGKSLQDIVKEKGALDEDLAVYYISQIADALKYVHNLNRLHLDIKPGNIMINENNQAILIDFGVSKQYDEVDGENTSTLLGKTPGYAPIEQMSNNVKNFTPATDIYALGATLYKLLTGITPPDVTEIFNEGLKGLPESVSDNIRIVVNKSMELRVKDRPQCINDFILLLNINSNTTSPIDDRIVKPIEPTEFLSQPDINEDTLVNNESTYLDVDLGLSVNWCNSNIEKDGEIYWGWSDISGKKNDTDLSLYPNNHPPKNICSLAQYDIATHYLGKGWRLPTKDEINELQTKCKWAWTSIEGEYGYKVIGKNGNSIFLPATGFRTGNSCNEKESIGYYWSGELSNNEEEAYAIFFNQNSVKTWSVRRYFGLAIRAVKDYK